MKNALLIGAACFLCSCVSHPSSLGGSRGRLKPAATVETGAQQTLVAEDVLNAAKRIGVVTVEVHADPVYQAKHRYRALPLIKVLESIAGQEAASLARNEIVFSCEDGYQAIVPGGNPQLGSAFLAISDVDAAPHQDWIPIEKPSGSFFPGPLYLVWTNESAIGLPWPYQISKIEIRAEGMSLSPAQPSSAPLAEEGFALFRRNCINCHSINGAGGKVGVDLNVPLNVTEYWRPAAIKKLIRSPTSVRSNAKMPEFPQLTESDVRALIAYLRDMRSRKLPPN